MTLLNSTLHDCVFTRTQDGRRAVVDPCTSLSDDQWRLLLMVNGETPFARLVDLAPEIDRPEVVGPLLYDGLIEPLQVEEPAQERPYAWRVTH